jgi:hypothetical protein
MIRMWQKDFLKWVGHMEWFAVRVSTSTNSKEHWNIAG